MNNLIKSTLRNSENAAIVSKMAKEMVDPNNHTELVRNICEKFKFTNDNGEPQVSTCLTALHELADEGIISLEKSSRQTSRDPELICLPEALPMPVGLSDNADELGSLTIKLVETEEEIHQWNTVYREFNDKKTHTAIGQTVKYLIMWGGFILGILLFGTSRINSTDRDIWIGWDKDTKNKYQNSVRGMELYIRAGIKCANFMHKIFQSVMEIFPNDHKELYGSTPMLVETFLPANDYSNQEVMEKLNWQYAGSMNTDWKIDAEGEVTYIWVIEPNFRREMGISSLCGLGARGLTDGLEEDNWAATEMSTDVFGDKRLGRSAIEILKKMATRASENLCELARGIRSSLNKMYRFFGSRRSEISVSSILSKHNIEVYRRAKNSDFEFTVFVQDTVILNFGGLTNPEKRGLRIIGANQTTTEVHGLKLHHVVAVSSTSLLLGEVYAKFIQPMDPAIKELPDDLISPADKESFKMIDALCQTSMIAKRMGIRNPVTCIDREGAYLLLFYAQRERKCMDLVVKATKNLKVHGTRKNVFQYMAKQAPIGCAKIQINHESARTPNSERVNKEEVKARTATCEIRVSKIALNAPADVENKAPLQVYCVSVQEINAPRGIKK